MGRQRQMFSVVTEKNHERMSRKHSVARNTHVARTEFKPNASPVPRRSLIGERKRQACQHLVTITNQINNMKHIIAAT